MSENRRARISDIRQMEKELEKEREELKENDRIRKKTKKSQIIKKFFTYCFWLGTVCCYIGLGVVYGPNRTFRDWFITTAEASMTHQYYARWFYDEDTIEYVMSQRICR